MPKLILAVLCLTAMACSYNVEGTPAARPQAVVHPEIDWRFKDGTTAGPGDRVEPPAIVTRIRAPYAEEPRKQRLQGDVGLELEVDTEGNVVKAVVTQPLEPSLDANAVEAARRWKFSPARLNGVARPAVIKEKVEYRVY